MSGQVVLVTGGSGFIGSHLVERLISGGDEVHVFDVVARDDARNLAAVIGHPNLRYMQGDLRNPAALARFYRPDAAQIFHLASVVGVRRYIADPLALIDVVVGGTRALLELARRGNGRFVLASTSEVYGRNPAVPWREDADRVLGPTTVDRWSYSSSKAVCEHMVLALTHQKQLVASVVRFFNAYGPRQNPIYVISQSIHRALHGLPPHRYDDGAQSRCFTFIDDVIEGLLAVARHPDAVGEVFNLGHTRETTITEAVECVLQSIGRTDGWEQFDTRQAYGERYEDIRRRVPDVNKARERLGWAAKTSLQDGVTRTVAWARDNPWWLDLQPS